MQEHHKNRARSGVNRAFARGSIYDIASPQCISIGNESNEIISCNSKKDASQALIFFNIMQSEDEIQGKDFSKTVYEILELEVEVMIFLK